MGFMCTHGRGECDGCMECSPEKHYYCPVCGKEVYDTVYVDNGGDVVGCENCIELKDPYEVFEDEIN